MTASHDAQKAELIEKGQSLEKEAAMRLTQVQQASQQLQGGMTRIQELEEQLQEAQHPSREGRRKPGGYRAGTGQIVC